MKTFVIHPTQETNNYNNIYIILAKSKKEAKEIICKNMKHCLTPIDDYTNNKITESTLYEKLNFTELTKPINTFISLTSLKVISFDNNTEITSETKLDELYLKEYDNLCKL